MHLRCSRPIDVLFEFSSLPQNILRGGVYSYTFSLNLLSSQFYVFL